MSYDIGSKDLGGRSAAQALLGVAFNSAQSLRWSFWLKVSGSVSLQIQRMSRLFVFSMLPFYQRD